MWYSAQEDSTYSFRLQRGVLESSPHVEQVLGGFLVSGLADEEQLKGMLRRLGLTAALRHFEAHVASQANIRIGDFGEIVAGHLIEEEEQAIRPIEKLRHRESRDWAMKLTDVFCVAIDNDQIVGFLFGEAKAGTTRPETTLGQEAYQRVYNDIQEEEPQILFFTLDRLRDGGNQTRYRQFEEAMHRTPPVARALRVVFLFDDAIWREEVLESLHNDFISGDLTLAEDFRCYVLTRDKLREVIDSAYSEAERMVANG